MMPIRIAGDRPNNVFNCCHIVALASILGVPFAAAFRLMRDQEVPQAGVMLDARQDLADVTHRLARLGFKTMASNAYNRLRVPALVFAKWRTEWSCDTLHAVVWDPKTRRRVDPVGSDTIERYNGEIVRVLSRCAA